MYLVAFVPGGECVHRDGRNFEPEEEGEHVARRHDGHAAEGGECDGADEFGNLVHLRFSVCAVLEVVLREPYAENRGDDEDFAHEHAEVVDFPVADEEAPFAASQRNEVQQDEDGDEPEVRDAPGQLRAVVAEQSAPDDDEGEQQQENVGNDEIHVEKAVHVNLLSRQ